MSITTKYTSLGDPDQVILVSKEKNWTDIKIYANGKLQHKVADGKELRQGKRVVVDDLGTLELHLKSGLEISLDGIYYEPGKEEVEGKVTNVSSIFWLLTIFTGIGFIFFLFVGSRFQYSPEVLFLIGLQLFALLVYGTTAILLKKGVYWFYFVGAGTYTFFSALTLLDIQGQLSNAISIVALIIRMVLLVLVLWIIPTVVKQMREAKSGDSEQILDQV